MDFNSSKTKENLMKAFAGESQARNRYTMFASIAKKEGYVQIQKIFEETARNELEHAKRFYNHLVEKLGGEPPTPVTITADFPVEKGTTVQNLKNAAAGEHEEHSNLYPAFATVATEEGFNDIAQTFKMIAIAEVAHEKRYLKLMNNINENIVFERSEKVQWKCDNCGYVLSSTKAPNACPACLHKQAYFQLKENNY